MAESCHGAIVRNGTNQTIVDSIGEIWTIESDDKIYKNKTLSENTDRVVLLVYWNSVVYQQNCNGGWWEWINNNWVEISDTQLKSTLGASLGCIYTSSSTSQGNS